MLKRRSWNMSLPGQPIGFSSRSHSVRRTFALIGVTFITFGGTRSNGESLRPPGQPEI